MLNSSSRRLKPCLDSSRYSAGTNSSRVTPRFRTPSIRISSRRTSLSPHTPAMKIKYKRRYFNGGQDSLRGYSGLEGRKRRAYCTRATRSNTPILNRGNPNFLNKPHILRQYSKELGKYLIDGRNPSNIPGPNFATDKKKGNCVWDDRSGFSSRETVKKNKWDWRRRYLPNEVI